MSSISWVDVVIRLKSPKDLLWIVQQHETPEEGWRIYQVKYCDTTMKMKTIVWILSVIKIRIIRTNHHLYLVMIEFTKQNLCNWDLWNWQLKWATVCQSCMGTATMKTGPFRNVGCYLYAFEKIKKTSTTSVRSVFQLAKKSLFPCQMIS